VPTKIMEELVKFEEQVAPLRGLGVSDPASFASVATELCEGIEAGTKDAAQRLLLITKAIAQVHYSATMKPLLKFAHKSLVRIKKGNKVFTEACCMLSQPQDPVVDRDSGAELLFANFWSACAHKIKDPDLRLKAAEEMEANSKANTAVRAQAVTMRISLEDALPVSRRPVPLTQSNQGKASPSTGLSAYAAG